MFINLLSKLFLFHLNKEEFNRLSCNEKIKYNADKNNNNSTNKKLKKELLYVKLDIIEGTFSSDSKYHKWIIDTKSIILPELGQNFKNHKCQLNMCPQIYLKHMLIMNKILEKSNKKLFQAISLRTEITDKYVHIDTFVIRDIFTQVNSNKTNDQLWNNYFNINQKKLISKRFTTYLIDEYKTSKLCNKNSQEGENTKVNKKILSKIINGEKILTEKKIDIKLHSVLTFKMSNNSECINRDNNASLNMVKIVKHLIETKKRPIEYCRQKKSCN
jgi:hypothetical protein